MKMTVAPGRCFLVSSLLLLVSLSWAATLTAQDLPRSIKPEAVLQWMGTAEKPLLLDVRTQEEFNKGHLRGALLIPHTEIGTRSRELGRQDARPIVVYCESGPRAKYVRWVLERQGFRNITLLDGHMSYWRKAKLPLQKPAN